MNVLVKILIVAGAAVVLFFGGWLVGGLVNQGTISQRELDLKNTISSLRASLGERDETIAGITSDNQQLRDYFARLGNANNAALGGTEQGLAAIRDARQTSDRIGKLIEKVTN